MKEGVHRWQLFIALLLFSFLAKLYEIIEPRLLKKRGFEPLNPPLDPALELVIEQWPTQGYSLKEDYTSIFDDVMNLSINDNDTY